MSHHKQMHDRLTAITNGCRDDMHKPDEQGLSARVVGDHLDSATGDHIGLRSVEDGFQEFIVILTRDGQREKFNLACLIALARKAQV